MLSRGRIIRGVWKVTAKKESVRKIRAELARHFALPSDAFFGIKRTADSVVTREDLKVYVRIMFQS